MHAEEEISWNEYLDIKYFFEIHDGEIVEIDGKQDKLYVQFVNQIDALKKVKIMEEKYIDFVRNSYNLGR